MDGKEIADTKLAQSRGKHSNSIDRRFIHSSENLYYSAAKPHFQTFLLLLLCIRTASRQLTSRDLLQLKILVLRSCEAWSSWILHFSRNYFSQWVLEILFLTMKIKEVNIDLTCFSSQTPSSKDVRLTGDFIVSFRSIV